MPLQCKWTTHVEGLWEEPRAVSVARSVKEYVDNVRYMGSKPQKKAAQAQGEKKTLMTMALDFDWQRGYYPGSWVLGTRKPGESLRKSPAWEYDVPSRGKNPRLLKNRIVFEREQAIEISHVSYLAWVMMMKRNNNQWHLPAQWRRPTEEKGYHPIQEIASKDEASSC